MEIKDAVARHNAALEVVAQCHNGPCSRRAQELAWQNAVATLWQLRHAVDAASPHGGGCTGG